MLQVTSSVLTCGRLSRSQRFAGMSLGKQHTAKKTNKLKLFTGRLSALLHHRARLQKKKSIVDEFLFVSCTNQQMIQTHLGKLSYFCSPNILRFGLLGRWAFSFFFSPKLLKFPLAGLGTKHVPKSKTHPRIQTLS